MRLYFDALTPIMLHSTLDSYAKINVLSTCVSVTVGLLASGKILTIKYVNTSQKNWTQYGHFRLHSFLLIKLFHRNNSYLCVMSQELARVNAELAKEREKLEGLANELTEEYEHAKQ